MGAWTQEIVTGLLNAVVTALTTATQAALNWVLGLLSATVFASPNVTQLPQVRSLAGDAQVAANACMILIVTVSGIIAMATGSVQDRYAVKELLPRLAVGFALANVATPIVSGCITAANALTAAVASRRFTSDASFNEIKRVVYAATTDQTTFLIALVLQLTAMIMLILLVLTWIGRIGVLLVLAGIGPVALMLHALPQTEAVAWIWWRSLLACLSVQFLQAATLHIAVATLLTPGANMSALGLPHDPTGLFNLLIACFLLWLVIRIPRWVARTVGGSAARAGSVLGSVIRVVVVQQALRAAGLGGGRLGRRGARSATAAIGRPLATHQHTSSHLHQHLHVHTPRPGYAGWSGGRRGRTTGRSGPGAAATRRPGSPRDRRRGVGIAATGRGTAAGTAGDAAGDDSAAPAPLAGVRGSAVRDRVAATAHAAGPEHRAAVEHRLAGCAAATEDSS